MKKIILILIMLISSDIIAQTNTNKLLACCDTNRGCTGSAYCTACKNCSGCKYCAKNGGSCGVCDGGNTKIYRKTKKKKITYNFTETKKKPTYTYTKIKGKFNNNSYLYVSSKYLNLRKGPSTNYKIIIRLTKDTKLKYLDKQNGWIKVKVVQTDLVGYVFYRYLY